MARLIFTHPQTGLSGPLDPVLAALLGFNTFEEVGEGITAIYQARFLSFPT